MNSLYNNALKQSHAIKRDLALFESGEDKSNALQGQISASLSALNRSIDDYESLSKKELIPNKRQQAEERVAKFREDFKHYKSSFEIAKRKEENKTEQQFNRQELFNGFDQSTYNTASGTTSISLEQHTHREHDFLNSTEQRIDEFIAQGQAALQNLVHQRGTLKGAHKKILDTANTLGLSRTVIQYIERRTTQDKWIFYAGVIISILLMWAIVHYLT
ncbi:V-snare-domain-containing protein [Basidiobolus meristosporus CBS 931.73]|uniref:Protein transport protein BOS1 n=1 Tax=Basidiobolus meristosporus CBS 931.73 TaxID=1314790 RepID=A0A1Y1YF98_9FUNG|nr:V-snare-domain-containing protein [Basidiobolus meristosporus CBS 931.73]|eukprot:ORX96376.1 V-snare-domain-containing protein [Basidiobolus meristosporus CBS 931.73]